MKPFEKRVWLSSPTMHGDEMKYIMEAYDTNWMSTLGANVQAVEQIAAQKAQVNYAVALSNCTAALHLCVKAAGERLYGRPAVGHGALEGKRVFCSDMTFDATVNPVVYEGGVPVFIAPGNHDYLTTGSPWLEERWPENVYIFSTPHVECVPIPELNVRVWGAAFTEPRSGPLLRGFEAEKEENIIDIMCIHGDVGNDASPYNPVSEEQISRSGMDYIGFGFNWSNSSIHFRVVVITFRNE